MCPIRLFVHVVHRQIRMNNCTNYVSCNVNEENHFFFACVEYSQREEPFRKRKLKLLTFIQIRGREKHDKENILQYNTQSQHDTQC